MRARDGGDDGRRYILVTEGLSKSFGDFQAVSGRQPARPARLDPRPDRPQRRRQDDLLQHADQVRPPERGTHLYNGRDITSMRPADVARLGLVRSFQISAVFPHLTALENVRIALQRQRGDNVRFLALEDAC